MLHADVMMCASLKVETAAVIPLKGSASAPRVAFSLVVAGHGHPAADGYCGRQHKGARARGTDRGVRSQDPGAPLYNTDSVTGCEPVVLCILEHDYYCRMPLQRPRSAGQWRRMPSCIMAIPEVRITDDSYFLHRTHMCTTRSWIDSCKADPT